MILHSRKPSLLRKPGIPATIVCNPAIMGGVPTVRGTRVPAEINLLHLRAGYSRRDIFDNDPSLPVDGIDAVIAWAEKTIGPDWQEKPVAA